jgi:hypothetical protein
MPSATLFFIDERQFLIVIQPVLPFHECADPAPAESVIEPLHSIVDSAATVDPADVESVVEPLHSDADPIGSSAALTKKFCLCVRV